MPYFVWIFYLDAMLHFKWCYHCYVYFDRSREAMGILPLESAQVQIELQYVSRVLSM